MTYTAVKYLRDYEFKPHIKGDATIYGLNTTGCDSTIWVRPEGCKLQLDEDGEVQIPKAEIWRFIYFNQQAACFTNMDSKIMELPLEYQDHITRLQVRPPEKLDPVLEDYLIDLYAYMLFNEEMMGYEINKEEVQVPHRPERTPEIEDLLIKTGFTENELMSALEICEPDIDGIGEASGGGYYFNLEELC